MRPVLCTEASSIIFIFQRPTLLELLMNFHEIWCNDLSAIVHRVVMGGTKLRFNQWKKV